MASIITNAQLQFWSGRLFLWPAGALYVGYAADTAVHAHHAIQLCLSLDLPFRLRGGSGSRWKDHELAMVEPDRLHRLDGRGGRLALLYLDPESDEGRALITVTPRAGFALPVNADVAVVRERLVLFSESACDAIAASDMISAWLRNIAPYPISPRAVESRVRRFLDRIRQSPELPASAADAAQSVGLSSHRFQHVFRDSTGIPFRRYLLWLRLVTAVQRVACGCSLTDAAHAAGFADSAHLSRTFRRMFGLTPSALAKGSVFVQAPIVPSV